jgi:hypothetical protein
LNKFKRATYPELLHFVLENVFVVAEGTLEEVAGGFGGSLDAAFVKPKQKKTKNNLSFDF